MTLSNINKKTSPLLVIIAFATVYIVWGSTYFFIRVAMPAIPPFLLGALRFVIAGALMMIWCIIKGEKIFIRKSIITSAIVGIFLLVGGNGAVILSEQTLPSAMVAILVSAAPIWFVLLDRQNWDANFKNRSTIIGLIVGFAGVILLFGEEVSTIFSGGPVQSQLPWMLVLIIGSMCWAWGSLYSKHKPSEGSAAVNVAWQMIIAGLVFTLGSLFSGEITHLQWQQIPLNSWLALGFLIVFGSIAAFSAYVWLLQVRPATQVSTYAYVNPVIAVILGLMFAHEHISLIQITGLLIILGSVLLINLSKYRKEKILKHTDGEEDTSTKEKAKETADSTT